MILRPETVAGLTREIVPRAYLRILRRDHIGTPLGMGFGSSRFSSPTNAFKVLYLAEDVATAIAETIVRDRFEGATERVLDLTEIEEWAVTEVTAVAPLAVLDVSTTGLLRLGVPTDAARGKAHVEGQGMSDALHTGFAVDGILYASRLTASRCFAVYERAVVPKLASTPAVELIRHADLIPALEALDVTVRA